MLKITFGHFEEEYLKITGDLTFRNVVLFINLRTRRRHGFPTLL